MTTFNILDKLGPRVVIKNVTIKEFLAEFLGTFVLVLMGNGAVAQVVMMGQTDFLSINAGYAMAVFLGVMISGGVSGGHINPAVSLAMAIYGKFPWAKVPLFIIAQYCGAFFGSLLLFLVYKNALDTFDPERGLASAGIFATFPGAVLNSTGGVEDDFLHSGSGMADQVVGTAILLMAVCAITDKRNMQLVQGQIPGAVALVVFSIGLSLGLNCGYAINPARDLGPRLFTSVAGWGALPFTVTTVDGVQWWWIPVLGPHLGAILGVGLYTLMIELHHDKEEQEHELEMVTKEVEANRNGTANGVATKSDQNRALETVTSASSAPTQRRY